MDDLGKRKFDGAQDKVAITSIWVQC